MASKSRQKRQKYQRSVQTSLAGESISSQSSVRSGTNNNKSLVKCSNSLAGRPMAEFCNNNPDCDSTEVIEFSWQRQRSKIQSEKIRKQAEIIKRLLEEQQQQPRRQRGRRQQQKLANGKKSTTGSNSVPETSSLSSSPSVTTSTTTTDDDDDYCKAASQQQQLKHAAIDPDIQQQQQEDLTSPPTPSPPMPEKDL